MDKCINKSKVIKTFNRVLEGDGTCSALELECNKCPIFDKCEKLGLNMLNRLENPAVIFNEYITKKIKLIKEYIIKEELINMLGSQTDDINTQEKEIKRRFL